MEPIQQFKRKLALLESMLNQMKENQVRVRQLKKSVYVLRSLLHQSDSIPSPYGGPSAIVRFSLQ